MYTNPLFYFVTKIDRNTQPYAEGSLENHSVRCALLVLLLNSPNGIFSVVVNNWALVPSEAKIDIIITENILILKDLILSSLNPNIEKHKIFFLTAILVQHFTNFTRAHICTIFYRLHIIFPLIICSIFCSQLGLCSYLT